MGYTNIVAAESFASLDDAIAAISSTPATLQVTTSMNMLASVVIPNTILLDIRYPGNIVRVTGILTINGYFQAGLFQVFSGFSSGAVVGLKEARPEYWGSGTDSIAFACAASNVVLLSDNIYPYSQAMTRGVGQAMIGIGQASIVKKISTANISGLTLAGASVKGATLKDFVMDGDLGNGGDGIVVNGTHAHMKNITVQNQGGWGIRIGADADGTSSNGWFMSGVRSVTNGAGGVYIHDGGASIDANAGTAHNLTTSANTGDGLKIANGFANTFIGLLSEQNGGYGVNIDPTIDLAGYNKIIGGDIEANETGAVYLGALSNVNTIAPGLCIGPNTVTDLGHGNAIDLPTFNNATYSPVIVGADSDGVGTYVHRYGKYTRKSQDVHFEISIEWTAHTGTGQMRVTLPFDVIGEFDYQPISVFSEDLDLAADPGSYLAALVYGAAGNWIQLYTSLDGVHSPLGINGLGSSGKLYLTGSYQAVKSFTV